MTTSSALETLIVAGVVPAVTMLAAVFAFATYYREAVKNYLQQTESAFCTYVNKRNEEDKSFRTLRTWSKQIYKAHVYRDAHGRSVKVTAAGAFGWVVAYFAQTTGTGEAIFTSPFGVPAPLGIKIMAVLAWGVAGYYVILVINKFGVRPEEVVEEEVEKIPETD